MATPSTAPQPPSLSTRVVQGWTRAIRWCTRQPWARSISWISLTLVGLLLLLLVIAPLVFLGDWLWSWQITRLWAQLTGTCLAILLIGWGIQGHALKRIPRIALLIGTVVLILTLLDSLNGQQDVFTDVVFITSLWSCLLAVETDRIARTLPKGTTRRTIGLTIGVGATLLFMGSALGYAVYNLRVLPLRYDHHILYLVGIAVSALLQRIQPPKAMA